VHAHTDMRFFLCVFESWPEEAMAWIKSALNLQPSDLCILDHQAVRILFSFIMYVVYYYPVHNHTYVYCNSQIDLIVNWKTCRKIRLQMWYMYCTMPIDWPSNRCIVCNHKNVITLIIKLVVAMSQSFDMIRTTLLWQTTSNNIMT